MAGKVNWYGDEVLLRVSEACAESVTEIAYQIEAQAKANIIENDQHDTGAMANSVYHEGPTGGNFDANAGAAKGLNPEAVIGPKPDLPNDQTAAVGSPVHYAVYQEALYPWLYPAVEQIAGEKAGAVLVDVSKKKGLL